MNLRLDDARFAGFASSENFKLAARRVRPAGTCFSWTAPVAATQAQEWR